MGIGLGIFFIAVGAILYFAVDAHVNGIDLAVVGIILMVVGAIGILVDLLVLAPRRRSSTTVIERPRARTTRSTDTY